MAVKIKSPGDPGYPKGRRGFYVYADVKGRRVCRHFDTEAQAKVYQTRAETLIALGRLDALVAGDQPLPSPGAPMTLAAWWEQWTAVAGSGWKPTTRERYDQSWTHHIRPTLGDTPLNRLTYNTLRAWTAGLLANGLAPYTADLVAVLLGQCLKEAVKAGLLPSNPAEGLRVPQRRERAEAEVLTREELAAALEAASPDAHPALLVAARTGLRLGEVCGLQVADVDLARGVLRVRRTVGTGGRQGSPKSGKARQVDLSPQAADAIREVLTTRQVTGGGNGWLFPGVKTGQGIGYSTMRNWWEAAQRAAGLPIRGFHVLRHTYATLMLTEGAPVGYVQRQLGHASAKVTLDVYGHVLPEMGRGLVDRLDSAPTPRIHPANATNEAA